MAEAARGAPWPCVCGRPLVNLAPSGVAPSCSARQCESTCSRVKGASPLEQGQGGSALSVLVSFSVFTSTVTQGRGVFHV